MVLSPEQTRAASTMQSLKKIRANIKGNITRIMNFAYELTSESPETTDALKMRAKRVEDLFSQFNDIEHQIITCSPSEDSHIEEVEVNYFAASALLTEWIRKKSIVEDIHVISPRQDESQFDVSQFHQPTPRVKLPALELPKFDGDSKKWQSFLIPFVLRFMTNRLSLLRKNFHI